MSHCRHAIETGKGTCGLTGLGDGDPLLLHGLEEGMRVAAHLVELVDATCALEGRDTRCHLEVQSTMYRCYMGS